jgi:hypothetical protein
VPENDPDSRLWEQKRKDKTAAIPGATQKFAIWQGV